MSKKVSISYLLNKTGKGPIQNRGGSFLCTDPAPDIVVVHHNCKVRELRYDACSQVTPVTTVLVSLFVSYPGIPTGVERYRAVSVGTKSPERKLDRARMNTAVSYQLRRLDVTRRDRIAPKRSDSGRAAKGPNPVFRRGPCFFLMGAVALI